MAAELESVKNDAEGFLDLLESRIKNVRSLLEYVKTHPDEMAHINKTLAWRFYHIMNDAAEGQDFFSKQAVSLEGAKA